MPEKDSTEWAWTHWAGTVAQLTEAARLASAKVQALAPYPEGYDPEAPGYDSAKHQTWLRAEGARSLSIATAEKNGYSSDLTDLAELEEIPERSFDEMESITITVGTGPYSPPSVVMRASGHGGLSVRINGFERTWTAGLRHELEQILTPTRRLYAPLIGRDPGSFIAGAVAFNGVLYGVIAWLKAATDWEQSTRGLVALGSALVVVLAIVAVRLASSRQFELLRAGQAPRYQRVRGRLFAAIGALILSLVASVIYAALS
jgi:hypothetical protein